MSDMDKYTEALNYGNLNESYQSSKLADVLAEMLLKSPRGAMGKLPKALEAWKKTLDISHLDYVDSFHPSVVAKIQKMLDEIQNSG